MTPVREQAREDAYNLDCPLDQFGLQRAVGADVASDKWEPLLRDLAERYVNACTSPGEPITQFEAWDNIKHIKEALG